MTNAMDYIAWRGDLSFASAPLNDVDLFLCSQLATPDYTGIVPEVGSIPLRQAAERYFSTHDMSVENLGVLQSVSVLPMLKALAEAPRFRDAELSHYVNRVSNLREEQFSAVTIRLAPDLTVIAIRGTDDTIIGWKEDCNLAVLSNVPAHLDAAAYLTRAAARNEGSLYLCGHSKGGNLAVYCAAVAADAIQQRIRRVCSFDGPGFRPDFLEGPGYAAMRERIVTILSKNAIVGLLLWQNCEMLVVNTDTVGPLAHDGFKWEVLGTGFVPAKGGLSDASRAFDNAMKESLSAMNEAERKAFIDELFDSLFASGADTITDFKKIGPAELFSTLKELKSSSAVIAFKNRLLDNLLRSYKDIELSDLKALLFPESAKAEAERAAGGEKETQ